jgi:hypothetical protein
MQDKIFLPYFGHPMYEALRRMGEILFPVMSQIV